MIDEIRSIIEGLADLSLEQRETIRAGTEDALARSVAGDFDGPEWAEAAGYVQYTLLRVAEPLGVDDMPEKVAGMSQGDLVVWSEFIRLLTDARTGGETPYLWFVCGPDPAPAKLCAAAG